MTIKNNKKRILMLLFTFFMLLISLIPTNQITQSVSAEKSIALRILCRFEDGQKIANLQSTDYFHYLTRSKSAVAETDDVDSLFLNKLLTVAGYDFITPNEVILGREIRPTSIPEEMPDTNQGPKVSAFDRFGMAGLRWSSYQGEWKYNYVEACANQNQVSPTNYETFYDGRLGPKSTHNEVSTSKDPRTIQFNKGALSLINSAAIDIFSNGLFGIAKMVVTLTIVFVGLAFTDVTQLIGLSADGTSGLTATGMFTDIFNSIFTSFILISFLFTALYLLYNGLFKRQFRMAISTLLKTIFIFIIAIVISTNPSYWIGVPNKIANYGQALVLSSMAGVYDNDTGQPTLCSTDVASIYDGVDLDAADNESGLMTEFEKVNKNMKSLIGCQMWEQLLFKPWVRGQFGAEYEDLYADKVDNINSSWVGNASVPLGNEETIDNWALFHLSTQTNTHAQIGDSNFPTRVNGVNADWWRVADALSNYDEAETVDNIGGGAYQETYMAPVNSEPTKFWQSWVGNNSIERVGSAIIAITFGIAGSIAPIIFSFSSVLYGLGITLLMMTSPLFLLFGTWAGKGQELFNSWLSTLVNTIIKKIAVSILLILSLALTMGIMDLAYSIGIVKSFILMIIVTTLLIKNKDKILNMMASVDFGGAFDLRTQANQFMNKQNQRAKTVGKVVLATAAGAKAGIESGQGAARGAKIGARSQIRNTLYQSTIGMHIIREADIHNDNREDEINCSMCYKLIGVKREIAYRDDEGNYYCLYCAEEIGIESLYEVTLGMKSAAEEITPIVEVESTRTKNASKNRSYLSHMKTKEIMGSVVIDGKYYWDDAAVQNMVKDNIRRLREDTVVFSTMSRIYGQQSRPPAPPEPLQNYIDIALINKAWTDNQPHVVENTYKEAWKMWYEDNAKHVEGITQEDIDKFKKEIEDYSPDVDTQTSEELIKQITTANQRSNFTDKDLYIYKNGKLVLNIYDRDVDFKERAKESYQDTPEVKKTKKDNE